MVKTLKAIVTVKGTAVVVIAHGKQDYISLTDIAKHKEPDRSDHVIQNWMRNRNTIEFLGTWERLNNPGFKPLEFEGFYLPAGAHATAVAARRREPPAGDFEMIRNLPSKTA